MVLNQLAYSLVWRLAEEQMSPLLAEEQIPVWAYSPLAQGLLTGKFAGRARCRVHENENGLRHHT